LPDERDFESRLLKTERAGMEIHHFGEVGKEIGEAVIAWIRVILVLHVLFL